MKHCGCTCMGILNFWTMAYTPNGTPPAGEQASVRGFFSDLLVGQAGDLHNAHMYIIIAGKPSVFLVRQLVHICGRSWSDCQRRILMFAFAADERLLT